MFLLLNYFLLRFHDLIQSFVNDFQNKVQLIFKAVVKTLAIHLSWRDLMLSDLQYFQFKPNSFDYEGTKSLTKRYGSEELQKWTRNIHAKTLNGLISYSDQTFSLNQRKTLFILRPYLATIFLSLINAQVSTLV